MVFADAAVTDVACAGLNGMRMGERVLTVRRATEVRPGHSASYSLSRVLCFSAARPPAQAALPAQPHVQWQARPAGALCHQPHVAASHEQEQYTAL